MDASGKMRLEETSHDEGAIAKGFPRFPSGGSIVPEGEELDTGRVVDEVVADIEDVKNDGWLGREVDRGGSGFSGGGWFMRARVGVE